MPVNSARIICQDVMVIDRFILGVSFVDMNGHVSFFESFNGRRLKICVSEKYYGLWARSYYGWLRKQYRILVLSRGLLISKRIVYLN
jgi:hypothetical protein